MKRFLFHCAALFAALTGMSQARVSGQVLDDYRLPVPYATIRSASHSIVADSNGYFSIAAPTGDSVMISAASFCSTSVKAEGSMVVCLRRKEEMPEVIVTECGFRRNRVTIMCLLETHSARVLTGTAKDAPPVEKPAVLWPNSARTFARLSVAGPVRQGFIADMNGRTLRAFREQARESVIELAVDDLPGGTYLLYFYVERKGWDKARLVVAR